MKSLIISLTLLIGIYESSYAQHEYLADITKSKITWEGKNVIGAHIGTILLKSGVFILYDSGKLKDVEFIADMSSINCTDIKDEFLNKKLVDHLKSEDFFNVSIYPQASFVINKPIQFVKGVGVSTITGDLSIKGITHSLTFKAIVMQQGEFLIIRANTMIDRTLYDIKYGSGSFFENLGDNMIYDEIFLTLNITAKKQ